MGIFPVAFMSLTLFMAGLVGCKSNPHKAEVLDTKTTQEDVVASSERIGVNSTGEMVYQKKVLMAEEIRKLQEDVYDMEDKVYGTRRYGSKGLYGKYSDCLKRAKPENKANLPKIDKLDRWSDKDEDIKIGIDSDKNKLASVTEEKLKDRISKFQEYRRVLQQKEDEYSENLKTCQALQ
jgi:hypothetical protein